MLQKVQKMSWKKKDLILKLMDESRQQRGRVMDVLNSQKYVCINQTVVVDVLNIHNNWSYLCFSFVYDSVAAKRFNLSSEKNWCTKFEVGVVLNLNIF